MSTHVASHDTAPADKGRLFDMLRLRTFSRDELLASVEELRVNDVSPVRFGARRAPPDAFAS